MIHQQNDQKIPTNIKHIKQYGNRIQSLSNNFFIFTSICIAFPGNKDSCVSLCVYVLMRSDYKNKAHS